MPLETPVTVNFGEDAAKELHEFVKDNVESLERRTRTLRSDKVNAWRNILRGVPEHKNRSFPWKNASNIVIALSAQHRDTLLATIMSGIYEIMPLWVGKLVGDWDAEEFGEEQRAAVENFMVEMALEPAELDLYRVEEQWFSEAIGLGTAVVKFPWETHIETEAIHIPNGSPVFKEFIKYDGPRPEKLPFEAFAITPEADTTEGARFKYHIRNLYKHDLLERAQKGWYSKEAINKILNSPDRFGPNTVAQEKEALKGIDFSSMPNEAQWDIYECWFPYWHNDKKYRIIYSYHKKSDTKVKAIFNFYPQNLEPYEEARLAWDDDGWYGYGFAEMLAYYQEDVTGKHNRRADNETLANTSIFRVGKNSKLDANFSAYPMALVPAEKDDFEQVSLGNPYNFGVDSEQLTLSLAKERTGIDPGMAGLGGGTTTKRGIYSSMGTFAVLQQGNRRSNLRTTDMRYSHIKLGRKFLDLYAYFGIGSRLKMFGNDAEYLLRAFDSIKQKRLAIAIRPATGSVNKELEKQNDMLLTQALQRHYMSVAQIIQALSNPAMPPELKSYYVEVIKGSDQLMKHLLRNFGHDDVSRLVPQPDFLKGQKNGSRQRIGGRSALQLTAGNNTNSLAGDNIPTAAYGTGGTEITGSEANTSIPTRIM